MLDSLGIRLFKSITRRRLHSYPSAAQRWAAGGCTRPGRKTRATPRPGWTERLLCVPARRAPCKQRCWSIDRKCAAKTTGGPDLCPGAICFRDMSESFEVEFSVKGEKCKAHTVSQRVTTLIELRNRKQSFAPEPTRPNCTARNPIDVPTKLTAIFPPTV